MNNPSELFLALAGGLLLGTVFFGGLWWTVRWGLSSTRPAILFLTSLLLRTAIACSGFYFISLGDWRNLVACLVGFLLARVFTVRFTRRFGEKQNRFIERGGT